MQSPRGSHRAPLALAVFVSVLGCSILLLAPPAAAQRAEPPPQPAPPATSEPSAPPPSAETPPGAVQDEVVVIGVTPTQGSELDVNSFPAPVQVVTGAELRDSRSLGVTDYLNMHLSGVSINAAQNNPLQPDVQYRGFTASPLLGLAQGLAVYQDGVRINEPLGDAVNWDLVPESAVYAMSLVGGASPLFGLNTLGGAISLQMKNGFNAPGQEASVSGGSFGRRVVDAQSGGNNGSVGYYLDANYFAEDGWRALSDSKALSLFSTLSLRGDATDADLHLQYANTDLRGNGAAPETLLKRDYGAIFTAPDITRNRLFLADLSLVRTLAPHQRVSGNLFWRRNQTRSFNGDASAFRPCPGAADTLCEGDEDADATPVQTTPLRPGASFADFDAINNRSSREQTSYGSTLQYQSGSGLLGHDNSFVAGIGYFRGDTRPFRSSLELASFDPDRSTEHSAPGPTVLDETTRVTTDSASYSSYFSDSLSLTEALTLTLSGRYNLSRIGVHDGTGERPEIEGRHDYRRFNPSLGFTYAFSPVVSAYASYSESSRAPTPIELSCNEQTFVIAAKLGSDAQSCRLPNAFVADPPLKQVVAHGLEAGLRGGVEGFSWSLGAFQTDNHNDIIFQLTGRSTGVFRNVAETRRLGFEAELKGEWGILDWFANYSELRATFQDSFSVLSPNHPFAIDRGDGRKEIDVRPGDRIPGMPEHRLKLGADLNLTPQFSVGVEYLYSSEQFLRGDEANLLAPVSAYGVFNLSAHYRPTSRLELSVRVENALDRRYATFGLLGEPAEGLPGLGDLNDVRFLGASAGRGVFGNVSYHW